MNYTETASLMMGGGLRAIGGAPTVAIIGERMTHGVVAEIVARAADDVAQTNSRVAPHAAPAGGETATAADYLDEVHSHPVRRDRGACVRGALGSGCPARLDLRPSFFRAGRKSDMKVPDAERSASTREPQRRLVGTTRRSLPALVRGGCDGE
jgi:hypothetical protein